MDDFLFVLLQEGPLENLPQSEKSWLDYTKSKKSFILHLFYGQIKSTVKCTVCNKESHTYETFSNLSLELPPSNNRCSLDVSKIILFNSDPRHKYKINEWASHAIQCVFGRRNHKLCFNFVFFFIRNAYNCTLLANVCPIITV